MGWKVLSRGGLWINSSRNIPIGSQLISCNCTIGLLSKVGFNVFIEATTDFWIETHLIQNICVYGNFMTRTQQPLPAKVVIPSRNNDISLSTCIFHTMSLPDINYTSSFNTYFYGLFMILSRTVTWPTNLDMCTFGKCAFFQSFNITLGFFFSDLPSTSYIMPVWIVQQTTCLTNWGRSDGVLQTCLKLKNMLLLNDPSGAIPTLVKLHRDSYNRVLSQILIQAKHPQHGQTCKAKLAIIWGE